MSFACSSNRKYVKSGFSLPELIAVILILGILSGIVVPKVFREIKKAKEASTEASLKSVKLAVDRYFGKVGKAPQNLKDLVKKPASLSKREWGGPYLDQEDLNDSFGNAFVYKLKPGGNPPYSLYSWGANGPGSSEEDWIEL